jgi:hypothetical protein
MATQMLGAIVAMRNRFQSKKFASHLVILTTRHMDTSQNLDLTEFYFNTYQLCVENYTANMDTS